MVSRKNLFVLFTSISVFLSAQTDSPYKALYSLEMGENNMYCDLYFIGNYYYMELVDIGEEGCDNKTLVLSYGTYETQRDNIFMKDEDYGFTMSFKKDGTELKAVFSFYFLMGNSFVKSDDPDYFDCESIMKNDVLQDKWERDKRKYNKMHRKEIPLQHGLYKVRNNEYWPFSLTILANGGYSFFYNGLCLSTGVYTREKNVLVLHDIYLVCSFHAFIGDGKITSYSLPGCSIDSDTQLFFQK